MRKFDRMRWSAALGALLLMVPAFFGAITDAAAKPNVVRHTVRRGETLSSIAAQYRVTVSSIVRWNALQKDARLTPGRKLGVPLPPGRAPEPGATPAATAGSGSGLGAASHSATRRPSQTWRDFARTPERAGWVSLRSYTRAFSGNVLDRAAEARLAEVLAPAKGESHSIDARLITLIARISDTFGGRLIHVISGYRPGGRSRHASGQAFDFAIEGVPNWAVREYLLTLERVGVGYYPNSHHVHLDVREQSTSWVDLSGPGRRARYLRPKRKPKRH
jgi:LysM repeat protein